MKIASIWYLFIVCFWVVFDVSAAHVLRTGSPHTAAMNKSVASMRSFVTKKPTDSYSKLSNPCVFAALMRNDEIRRSWLTELCPRIGISSKGFSGNSTYLPSNKLEFPVKIAIEDTKTLLSVEILNAEGSHRDSEKELFANFIRNYFLTPETLPYNRVVGIGILLNADVRNNPVSTYETRHQGSKKYPSGLDFFQVRVNSTLGNKLGSWGPLFNSQDYTPSRVRLTINSEAIIKAFEICAIPKK